MKVIKHLFFISIFLTIPSAFASAALEKVKQDSEKSSISIQSKIKEVGTNYGGSGYTFQTSNDYKISVYRDRDAKGDVLYQMDVFSPSKGILKTIYEADCAHIKDLYHLLLMDLIFLGNKLSDKAAIQVGQSLNKIFPCIQQREQEK